MARGFVVDEDDGTHDAPALLNEASAGTNAWARPALPVFSSNMASALENMLVARIEGGSL